MVSMSRMHPPDSLLYPAVAAEFEQLVLPDGELFWYPRYCAAPRSDLWLQQLSAETPWRQDRIRMHGKTLSVPRLQAWYGVPEARYGYSGILLAPLPFTPLLQEIRDELQQRTGHQFNAVLLNNYRDGSDSVSWHSDDEKELGSDPIIASLSLGSSRRFELRHKTRKDVGKLALELSHGSLLLMGSGLQSHWQHQIPKQSGITLPRLNLTFRFIA
jgi:alkylated DNA repair dioxygenase AlkB